MLFKLLQVTCSPLKNFGAAEGCFFGMDATGTSIVASKIDVKSPQNSVIVIYLETPTHGPKRLEDLVVAHFVYGLDGVFVCH